MLAKKTSKNQITLPKSVIVNFKDVDYFDITAENGRIILDPVRVRDAYEVREKLESLGIKEADIDAAIRYGRNNDK